MMATSRNLRDRSDTRKDLREHSNPYKRHYTATQKLERQGKPITEKSQEKAVPQKLRRSWHGKIHGKNFDQTNRSLDRKYQERQSPSDDAGTEENSEGEERQGEDGETEINKQEGGVGDQILQFHQGVDELVKVENSEAEERQGEDGETEINRQEGGVGDQILQFHQGVNELVKVENSEAEERQGEDGETEINRQEGGVGDQILQFHQGVDELVKVLVAGFQNDNNTLKNQHELQNSEYVNQVVVLKDQNKILTNQVDKKTTECEEVEQIAAQLKNEVETHRKQNEALRTEIDSFKEKIKHVEWFEYCALKLEREVETHRKQNEALRTEKYFFKEENDSLKRQVEESITAVEKSITAKVEPIAAQLNKTVELLKSEFVKSAELKNQLVKWKTDCEKEAQARKELESQLTAFWIKLGIAIPPSTSSGFITPPTTERKPIRSTSEDAGN